MGRKYSEIVWLPIGRTASTSTNTDALTGLPNTYGGSESESQQNSNQTPAPAPSATPSGTVLSTTTINGVTVLTNANGLTLYSNSTDTPTSTVRHDVDWISLPGPVTAGPCVTGTITMLSASLPGIGVITQAVYNGHPLYTYTGDSLPGMATGDGLNDWNGVWHVVPVS